MMCLLPWEVMVHFGIWLKMKTLIALISSFYNNQKPIAFVCHAPAVLKNVKVNDEFLVNGKKLTGFTNTEEAAVGLSDVVPFLLEDELQKNGAIYSKAADWQPYAVEDDLLLWARILRRRNWLPKNY